MPSYDEERDVHPSMDPNGLPEDIQLVYVDDRDRRRTVAIDDAAGIDFGVAKAFRKPPAYRDQRNFPGWWWSATTRSHVLYESWLERHHVIEADRDARVVAILGQPFELTWSAGNKKQDRHVPDLFCGMFEGLKYFMDHVPATFVLTGINVENRGFFNKHSGEQLARRFTTLKVSPSSYSATSGEPVPHPCVRLYGLAGLCGLTAGSLPAAARPHYPGKEVHSGVRCPDRGRRCLRRDRRRPCAR